MRKGFRATPISSRNDRRVCREQTSGKERSMTTQAITAVFIDRLREAVRSRDVETITEKIKRELEEFIPAEGLILPDHFRQAKADTYARRLLHRDEELDFTAVV